MELGPSTFVCAGVRVRFMVGARGLTMPRPCLRGWTLPRSCERVRFVVGARGLTMPRP